MEETDGYRLPRVEAHDSAPKERSTWLDVFVFNVLQTAKVIWRRGHGLKSHPTDW